MYRGGRGGRRKHHATSGRGPLLYGGDRPLHADATEAWDVKNGNLDKGYLAVWKVPAWTMEHVRPFTQAIHLYRQ